MKYHNNTYESPLPFARVRVASPFRVLLVAACAASAVVAVSWLCQDEILLLTIWLHPWMRDCVFYDSFPLVWTGVLLLGVVLTLTLLTKWLYRREVARAYRLILVGNADSDGNIARARGLLCRPTEFIETFLLEQLLTATERLILCAEPLAPPDKNKTANIVVRIALRMANLFRKVVRRIESSLENRLPGSVRQVLRRTSQPALVLGSILFIGIWQLPTYQAWYHRVGFAAAIIMAVSAVRRVQVSLRFPILPPRSPLEQFVREWTVQARDYWLAKETIEVGARQMERELWHVWSAADGALFSGLRSATPAIDPALREAHTFLAGLDLEPGWIGSWDLTKNLRELKAEIRKLIRARLAGCLRMFYAVRLLAVWRAAYWGAEDRQPDTRRKMAESLIGALRGLIPRLPDGLSEMADRVCRSHDAGHSVTLDSNGEWYRYRENLDDQLHYAVRHAVTLNGDRDEFVSHLILLIDVALLPSWRIEHKELGRLAVRALSHSSAAAEDACQLGRRTADRSDEGLAEWLCLAPLRGGFESNHTFGASVGAGRTLTRRFRIGPREQKQRQYLTERYLRQAIPVLYSFYPIQRSQVLKRFLLWD